MSVMLERWYLPAIFSGVVLTCGKFIKNFLIHFVALFDCKRRMDAAVTFRYPDEARSYSDRYRGRHRLTLKEDGSVRCTACFLCATACPAKCIYIEPAEHQDCQIEKFPSRYEIDTLRCIYCGYCVEACPVDAIRMDTGVQPKVYAANPNNFIEDKEILMERSRSLQQHGREGLLQSHVENICALERKGKSALG